MRVNSVPGSGTLLPLLALLLSGTSLDSATLTVAPDGPLSSLAAARDAIRQMRASGKSEAVTVQVRAGTYRLREALTLNASDSDVTWTAYPNEHPVISGGKVIDGWKKIKGPIWNAPVAGDFHQLFINGRRAQRARSPNYGY